MKHLGNDSRPPGRDLNQDPLSKSEYSSGLWFLECRPVHIGLNILKRQ
jgi:hypothetical protein